MMDVEDAGRTRDEMGLESRLSKALKLCGIEAAQPRAWSGL